jgi:hypothetical protein
VIEKSSIDNFVNRFLEAFLGIIFGLIVGLICGYFVFSGGNVASEDQLEQAKLKALELEYLEGRVKSLEEKTNKAIQQKPSGQAHQATQADSKEITIFLAPKGQQCEPCDRWKRCEMPRFMNSDWKVAIFDEPHSYPTPTFEIQRGSRRLTHVGYLSFEAAERIGL